MGISASISRGKLVSGTSDATAKNNFVPTFADLLWIEFVVLAKRSVTSSRHQSKLYGIRLFIVLITDFILASILWRLDDTPKGVQKRMGFFTTTMSTMFYTCANAHPIFLQERYIFMWKTTFNDYRRSYVLPNSIVGIPALILLSVAFAATRFLVVGFTAGAQSFFLIVLASF